jgi:5-enolpyruvylshikimate-3-phosphate synthase
MHRFKVRGDVSSQFLTALLMALPLVAAKDIVIEVVGELISRPYIEITLNLLARFGIQGATRRLAALHHSRRPPSNRRVTSTSRQTPHLLAIS